MSTETMHGVIPILVTPFTPDGTIDVESLRSVVEFNLNAGVHGLGIALASEVFKLSEAERDQVASIVVDQVNGRVPVVMNTGAPGTDLSILYSRRAQELGADALMVLPPSLMPATHGEVVAFYQAISAAVSIPIFMQDHPTASVSAAAAQEVADSCEWVRHIKVESEPITAKIVEMKRALGDRLTIFGGAGGGYFIEELRRGSVGTMPFCSQPETFVQIWDLYQAGDEAGAMTLFNRMLVPVARVVGQSNGIFYYVHKTLLRHRGIIESATVRAPAPPVEAQTAKEVEALFEQLYP
jgi:dihydrodipicolinate synthase/N-acetylneuraminate lyase